MNEELKLKHKILLTDKKNDHNEIINGSDKKYNVNQLKYDNRIFLTTLNFIPLYYSSHTINLPTCST